MNEINLSEFCIDPEDYGGYTAKEIYNLWRGSKKPNYEIKILSQLCDYTKYNLDGYPESNGLSETTKRAIIDDFRTEKSLELIAEKRSVSYSSVYKVLRESGVLKGRCKRIHH